jgi:hypothetical protein
MTDKELLEYAAKAVGGELSEGTSRRRTGETWDDWEWAGPMGITVDGLTGNPLTDDGEAFRLMVKLRLLVNVEEGVTFTTDGTKENDLREPHSSDSYAATRRAIVRAAAEIGKGINCSIVGDVPEDTY